MKWMALTRDNRGCLVSPVCSHPRARARDRTLLVLFYHRHPLRFTKIIRLCVLCAVSANSASI